MAECLILKHNPPTESAGKEDAMACKVNVNDPGILVSVSKSDLPITLKLTAFPGNPKAGVKAGVIPVGMTIESVDYFVAQPAPGKHTGIKIADDGMSFQLLATDMIVGLGSLAARLSRPVDYVYLVVEDCAPVKGSPPVVLYIHDPTSRTGAVQLEVTA
jgi:hypothetical protein